MSWNDNERDYERVEEEKSSPSGFVLAVFWVAQSVGFWRKPPSALCAVGEWLRIVAILCMSWLVFSWVGLVVTVVLGTVLRWFKERFGDPKRFERSENFWVVYDVYWHVFGALVSSAVVVTGLWAMQWSGWWFLTGLLVALLIAVEPGIWLLQAWVARVVKRGRVPRPETGEKIAKAIIQAEDEKAIRRLRKAGF